MIPNTDSEYAPGTTDPLLLLQQRLRRLPVPIRMVLLYQLQKRLQAVVTKDALHKDGKVEVNAGDLALLLMAVARIKPKELAELAMDALDRAAVALTESKVSDGRN